MNTEATTKTAQILQLSSPWDNAYQGRAPRILFVCSAGLLRSPTGAAWGVSRHGWNTRSCGSEAYALIPLTPDLIMWAHRIVFVNPENFSSAMNRFAGKSVEYYDYKGFVSKAVQDLIREKAVVLDIPDNYDYCDPFLYKCFDAAAPKIIDALHGLIPAQVDGEYTDQWIGAEVVGQQENNT